MYKLQGASTPRGRTRNMTELEGPAPAPGAGAGASCMVTVLLFIHTRAYLQERRAVV